MSLAVIAYPVLLATDLDWIQRIRQAHDPLCSIVDPHFTLVFPLVGPTPEVLSAHAAPILRKITKIDFTLRRAAFVRDVTGACSHVFLVPDRGRKAILELHGRLYSGPLEPHLRVDVPFTPHVTVGRNKCSAAAKSLADDLNALDFAIPGELGSFAVVDFDGRQVTELSRIDVTGRSTLG